MDTNNVYKKILITIIAFSMLFLTACGNEESKENTSEESAKFHIGLVIGTTTQSRDVFKTAEKLIEKYGDANLGGYICHLNYPDNFPKEQDNAISQITSFIEDEKIKAVVVNQGITGTAEAFKIIKEKRPDILCFVSNSHEEPDEINKYADLVIDPDNIKRGYLIPLCAKKMGAKTFAHVSFKRHRDIEQINLRERIMKATCKKIGLEFVSIDAPDPASDGGVAEAQNFILDQFPLWIKKYGKDTAFFSTNDAHIAPLIKKTMEYGAIFVEQDLPSPSLGYKEALGINEDLSNHDMLHKEEMVLYKENPDRMGTWVYSYGSSTTELLVEIAMRFIRGEIEKPDKEKVLEIFEEINPDADWKADYSVDKASGEKIKKHILVYQDTYIFGKGFSNIASETIPDIEELLNEYEEENIIRD